MSSCGGGSETPVSVPADELCAGLVEAACDREAQCGAFLDRPTCVAMLADVFDGCPLNVNAVALQEADYDSMAAARLLDAIRASVCGSDLPDAVTGIPVFTPKLGVGAVCHSDVSCTTGLTCDDVTVTDPQGVCTSI